MEIPGYKIEKEIGKGGMATVYLAIQESLKRLVVLKILNKVQGSSSEEVTQRFIYEGRIVASLHHPNIITIYDIGLSGEYLYISMEYVRGGDLKKRMASHISPKLALDIISKIGSALGSTHTHSVIHRDVKPANILFREDGTPLLTDFGIAKQTDFDKDLTSVGIFLGSPNYASPEQAGCEEVDGRSDIYSLGCIFYEMLTGYKPFHSNSVIDIVIQHKMSPVPTLPKNLSIYQSLLNKMMSKNPDDRFKNAKELLKSVTKLQVMDESSNNRIIPDFDLTGEDKKKAVLSETKKKSSLILISLLILSAIFFFGLQFVEINLKSSDTRIDKVSTNSVLLPKGVDISTNLVEQRLNSIKTERVPRNQRSAIAETTTVPDIEQNNVIEPASEQVIRALAWLGKQCLDEYKLTYPPKDNAYYYFSRLLELQPDNRSAYKGILAIAEHYAILAERSLINNELEKTKVYIKIGLKINPQNKALLSLQSIVVNKKTGFWQTLKFFF